MVTLATSGKQKWLSAILRTSSCLTALFHFIYLFFLISLFRCLLWVNIPGFLLGFGTVAADFLTSNCFIIIQSCLIYGLIDWELSCLFDFSEMDLRVGISVFRLLGRIDPQDCLGRWGTLRMETCSSSVTGKTFQLVGRIWYEFELMFSSCRGGQLF